MESTSMHVFFFLCVPHRNLEYIEFRIYYKHTLYKWKQLKFHTKWVASVNRCLLMIDYGDSGGWYSQNGTAIYKFLFTQSSLIVVITYMILTKGRRKDIKGKSKYKSSLRFT